MSIEPEFGGHTYNPLKDGHRLRMQLDKVRSVMFEGGWHRLAAIAERVQASEASVSARIRDLRKPKFGAYTIERRRVEGKQGLYEYRLSIPAGPAPELAHGKTRSENAGAP